LRSSIPQGSRFLAGDSVLVAIETPVVRHRESVEPRTALEARHGRAARVISCADPPEPVRVTLVQIRAVFLRTAGMQTLYKDVYGVAPSG